jgi:homocysteine S-methyltransferase
MPRPALRDVLADRPIVLDGGLGTLLERRGADVGSELWSARVLADEPERVLDAHREYFSAGAEVAITASYQVTFEGCERAGLDRGATRALLERSVELATRARDEAGHGWVAASVGPYGAMLGDGSEYRGDLGLDAAGFAAWHRERIGLLADSGADLLAVETVGTLAEVEGVARALAGTGASAWIAVTPQHGRLRDGGSLAEAFAIASDAPEVIAVGVNCCAPDEVSDALATASAAGTPRLAYPNSGESWDGAARAWRGDGGFDAERVGEWRRAGARLVGGCCRTGPEEIAAIARMLGRTPGAADATARVAAS